MQSNINSTDKVVRVVLAIVIITLFITGIISGVLAYILLGVAAILVLTSFLSFCPLYAFLGLSTRKKI